MNLENILKYEKLILLLMITCLGIINLNMFFMFPPTEGWWQNYAYWNDRGLELYKDINIAYTPFYVKFVSLLLEVSDLFIVHRMIGVLLTIFTYLLLYSSLRVLGFSFFVSITASFIATILSFLNIVYLPIDYPILLNFFVVMSTYLLLLSVNDSNNNFQTTIFLLFTALFTIVVFFVKQNIGLLLIVAYLSSVLYLVYIRQLKLRQFIPFIVGLIIFFFIIINYLGMTLEDLLALTIQNDSKGNVGTLIFRIFDENNLKLYSSALLLVILLIWIQTKEISNDVILKYKSYIITFVFCFILYFLYKKSEKAVSLAVLVHIFYSMYLLFKKDRLGYLFFIFGAHVIAIIMTAGICIAGVWIILAFSLAYMFKFFENKTFNFIPIIVGFTIVLFFSITVKKFESPYNWWGLSQSKINLATNELPYKEMKGIKVDNVTKKFFDDVKGYADKAEKGNMYFYPHIPIFYMLHNSKPPTKNYVQWFDVIRTKDLEKEIIDIKQKEPSLIVILNPGWLAYKGHYSLKQSDLLQPKMVDLLENFITTGKYELKEYVFFDQKSYNMKIDQMKQITINLKVINPFVFNKTIVDLQSDLVSNNLLNIKKISSKGIDITQNLDKHQLESGDILQIVVMKQYASDAIKLFGMPDKTETNFYHYAIFVKKENNEKN